MTDQIVLNSFAGAFPNISLGKELQLIKCPFHGDESPSMAIYLTKDKEHVHCFSCGYHAGFVRFLADIEGKSIKQKLTELGLILDDRVDVLQTIVDIFNQRLESGEITLTNSEKIKGSEFLTTVRGHDIELLKKKRIGVTTQEAIDLIELTLDVKVLKKLLLVNKKNELLIPVGVVVFPVIVGGEPVGLRWKRYAPANGNPKKKIGQQSKDGWIRFSSIYNRDFITAEVDDLFIVEGEDDALKVEAHGGTAVAFIGGCSPRDKRLELLKYSPAKRIIVATDNDEAGQKYAENISNWLRKNKREAAIYIPEKNDIAEDLDDFTLDVILTKLKVSKYGLREVNNSYWENSHKLSNFTMELKAKIISDETYLVLELVGEKEPMAKTIIIPNRLIGDKSSFNQFVKKEGCFTWLGQAKELDELITEKWSQELPVHFAIDYIGKVELAEYERGNNNHVFILPDRIFMPDGSESESDQNVFWVSEKRGLFLEIPDGITKHSDGIKPDESQLDDLLKLMDTPEYLLALGWFVAVPWALEIQKKIGGFPILWLSGERGSGKTTFASFLMGLYAPLSRLKDSTSAFLTAAGTTPEGLSRALSRFSCMPVLFDDLRSNTFRIGALMEIMRALYDRYSIQKGRLTQRDSMKMFFESRKMRANLVVTSQHHPEDDALSQRVLELNFKKKNLSSESLMAFRAIIRNLFSIGLSLNKRSLTESFPELDVAMKMIGSKAISDRRLQASAVAYAGLMKIGITKNKIKSIMKNYSIFIDRTTQESDEVKDFFERLRILLTYNQGELWSYIGYQDHMTWIAPSYLYQLLIRYTKGDLPYTSRSIKSLLKAQEGAVSFLGDTEKVVATQVGEKWTSVRAVFFDSDCQVAKQINLLSQSNEPSMLAAVQTHNTEKEEKYNKQMGVETEAGAYEEDEQVNEEPVSESKQEELEDII